MRVLTFVLFSFLSASTAAKDADEIFIVQTSNKAPQQIVDAIRTYSDEMKWAYLGDNKVKRGEVTLVKICIPEVGREVWPAGLKLSALLPCGNIGVYQDGDGTEISVLNPSYMHILYPDPATMKAAEIATPLLVKMLDAVAE